MTYLGVIGCDSKPNIISTVGARDNQY